MTSASELFSWCGITCDPLNEAANLNYGLLMQNLEIRMWQIESSCHFSVKDAAWSEMLKPEINTLIVPKGFLCHLAMLTVGTSRGILHAKTDGTCFNKYVLPTINVTEIIKEDATFGFIKAEK